MAASLKPISSTAMKTLFLTTVALAALIMIAPIGTAHAGTAWWRADCSLARLDNGTLDSPASEFESWTAAGNPTQIVDKGNEVILKSRVLDLIFWHTKEACLADKAADAAKLDKYR
jgi:hypothetical protein